MALEVSPLAPKRFPSLPEIDGLQFATAACGVKYKGRPDVCLMVLDPGSTVAGVLTRSKTASAPVEWCRAQLPHGRARAVIVNSGNANAFTGKTGETSVKRVVQAVAGAVRLCGADQRFTSRVVEPAGNYGEHRLSRMIRPRTLRADP